MLSQYTAIKGEFLSYCVKFLYFIGFLGVELFSTQYTCKQHALKSFSLFRLQDPNDLKL